MPLFLIETTQVQYLYIEAPDLYAALVHSDDIPLAMFEGGDERGPRGVFPVSERESAEETPSYRVTAEGQLVEVEEEA